MFICDWTSLSPSLSVARIDRSLFFFGVQKHTAIINWNNYLHSELAKKIVVENRL